MNFSKIIFDFDGTLVDSMPTWIQKMLRILQKEGISYSDDLIKTITPLGDIGTAEYFKNVLGVKASIEEMINEMNNFAMPEYENNIILKQGISEFLEFLKQKKISINILTASPHSMLTPCLKRNGIYEMFDNIWSCEDFGKSKSDPSIYTDAILRLDANPGEIIFFDDNVNAIRAAATSGLFTVGVYDESGKFFSNEMQETADVYIDSFLDLTNKSNFIATATQV